MLKTALRVLLCRAAIFFFFLFFFRRCSTFSDVGSGDGSHNPFKHLSVNVGEKERKRKRKDEQVKQQNEVKQTAKQKVKLEPSSVECIAEFSRTQL